MRLCSRNEGCGSVGFAGSGRLTCVTPRRPRSAQLASSNASSAGTISRRAAMSPLRKSPFTSPSNLISQNLDLLGTRRLHPGAAPLLDPSANSHAPPIEGLRRQPRGGKHALIALGDRDGEVLRPAPPEIHVDRAAAFAYRQHLAFHQRKPAALFQHLGRVF